MNGLAPHRQPVQPGAAPVLVTSWQFSLLAGPQASGQLAMAFLQALVGLGTSQSNEAVRLPALRLLSTPSPWPFRPDSYSAPAPRPVGFQPLESLPGVPPPTTALADLLLGGRGSPRDRGYAQGRPSPSQSVAGRGSREVRAAGREGPGPRYAAWGIIQGHLPGHTRPRRSSTRPQAGGLRHAASM